MQNNKDDSTELSTEQVDALELGWDRSSRMLGPFKLLSRLGSGSQGEVWLAAQKKPVRRRVALKVLHSGRDSAGFLSRFAAERQALALMDHANIAKIFEAGVAEDKSPYFAMEFCEGQTLLNYCDSQRLSINDRLRLFVEVCEGVQHAHQKGIIHRDLKPSNILVAMRDGVPIPKIIDFGLAKATQPEMKLTDETVVTEIGGHVGTYKYMSPEQAGENPHDVDTRSDIYSLGVILCELLTGSTPLDWSSRTVANQTVDAVLKTIREGSSERPSTLVAKDTEDLLDISSKRNIPPQRLHQVLRGEMDWIVMKSLERDRTRRYPTAAALAEDIGRYLANEPIEARPPSVAYRFKKFAVKHKSLVASAMIFATVFVAGATGTTIGYFRSEHARKEATTQLELREAAEIEANDARHRAETTLELIVNAFRSPDPTVSGKDVKVYDLLISTKEALIENDELSEVDKAEVLVAIGSSLKNLGLYKDASDSFFVARNLLVDSGAPGTRASLSLAESLAYESKIDQSRQQYELLHQDLQKRGLTESDAFFETLAGLAFCYGSVGDFNKALPYMEASVNGLKKVRGESDRQTMEAMNNLAFAYNALGRAQDALDLHTQLYEKRKEAFGELDVDTLLSLNNVASLQLKTGDTTNAIESLLQVYRARQEVLPDTHKDLAISMQRLLSAFYQAGRYEEADELLLPLEKRLRASIAKENGIFAATLLVLGQVYFAKGDFERAQQMLDEILDLSKNQGAIREEVEDAVVLLADIHLTKRAEQRLNELFSVHGGDEANAGSYLVQQMRVREVEGRAYGLQPDESTLTLENIATVGDDLEGLSRWRVKLAATYLEEPTNTPALLEIADQIEAAYQDSPLHNVQAVKAVFSYIGEQASNNDAKNEWSQRALRAKQALERYPQ